MKQKKFLSISIVLFCICFLCSCSQKEKFLEDTYIEGQDYQYMYEDREVHASTQAKGENGYYLFLRNFLYFFDNETQKIVPLCNRPDCLHDKEENEEQKERCHAYFYNPMDDLQIQYYDGNLYSINSHTDNLEECVLYKIPLDGSERTIIKTFDRTKITYWITHRGYLYYMTGHYSFTDEEGGTVSGDEGFFRLSLKNPSAAIEQIYETPKGLYGSEIHTPKAYGNHIYFTLLSYTASSKIITPKNEWQYTYNRMFNYNIRTKELTEITINDDCYVGHIEFYKDKLLFRGAYPYEREQKMHYGRGRQWYTADLDGSNRKKFFYTDYKWDALYCDGKYIYEDNYSRLTALQSKEEQRYRVYDLNMNLIDTIKLPFDGPTDLVIGDEHYLWFLQGDAEAVGVSYFDKSKIGTVNGKYPDIVDLYKTKMPAPDGEYD